jgi:hypothetical protein
MATTRFLSNAQPGSNGLKSNADLPHRLVSLRGARLAAGLVSTALRLAAIALTPLATSPEPVPESPREKHKDPLLVNLAILHAFG